ncbi:MAG: ABC transporter ATP-binding protein [Actinobacteria bacterium]|nr:ABC transporter ATP-binding protein [Actinomycetota bacterium]
MAEPVGPSAPGGIEVRGVTRRFGSIEVLRDATLDAGPGAVVGIVGANGSGKTTLLRILAGVLAPDTGTVRVGGGAPGRGRTGFIGPGDRGLYWRLTGRQNLDFFSRLAGGGRDDLGGIVAALGADHLLDRRMGVCSTGERRRIAIARGFAGRPPVVLVDEPYADLDEEGCAGVESLCRGWAEGGGTVVYAAPVEHEGPPADVRLTIEAGALVAAT